ncbi:hypothetical protein WJ23_21605 [Burkholderia lata]|nr:hypothetical protein WJ23_21605 [Burkholderia lata]
MRIQRLKYRLGLVAIVKIENDDAKMILERSSQSLHARNAFGFSEITLERLPEKSICSCHLRYGSRIVV